MATHVMADTTSKTSSSAIRLQLDTTLEQFRVSNKVPALSVGIIENGQIYYQKGFGSTASETAVTANTKFRVASITKLFTAQAVMQLVEKGKIRLDDDVGEYLPIFDGRDISILELMTHHSGLKDKTKPTTQSSIEEYFQSSIEKQKTLKKSFEYADLNFNTLGAIVAKVSSTDYPEYVNDHIIKPLKLGDTGFRQLGDEFLPDVDPHMNGWKLRKAPDRPYDPAFAPSEGLVTTAHDLLTWLAATLSQDQKLLKPNTFAQMLRPRKNTSYGEIRMGLGWQLYGNEHGQVMQHAGSFKGVKALLIAYPDIQRGIVILSNAEELPRWEIADAINSILPQHADVEVGENNPK